MKKRILNLGIAATHALITPLNNINDAISISDFDAFAFDPAAVQPGGVIPDNYGRRQREIHDLVTGKGGLVICLMRQIAALNFTFGNRQADTYGILDNAAPNPVNQIRPFLRAGSGSHVEVLPGVNGALAQYFRVLQRALSFVAYLETVPATLENVGGKVFALDSVPHPIGVEFKV
jgi:hypothetical protein